MSDASSPDDILALIPARSGSKRLPGKNLRSFCGKPLIQWTIDAALSSGVARHVVVSTDDSAIAECARAAGAEVPFLRPPELASDTASSEAVALHAIDALASQGVEPKLVLLLQPTSPLRTPEDIRAAVELQRSNSAQAVVSVMKPRSHLNCFRFISGAGTLDSVELQRRGGADDASELVELNGALYLISVELLRKGSTFSPSCAIPYVMPRERSVDIDFELDFRMAEFLFKS
ncbi:MAG: acylneuraminate cytidylyltransferase family protein [Bdellovibrionota bacterium]